MTDTAALKIWVPFLPPSENRIRVHRRQGGQVYSKEARDFKILFSQHLRENYFTQISDMVSRHTEKSVYALTLCFSFDTVINKGWAKGAAKTRYKKFDVGNRRKLIEDCLVEALGGEIDDCLFFDLHLRKEMGDRVGVFILLEPSNPEDYGVPDG
jgi:Holliday junction resolvase RusA-like endonuclease